MITHTTVTVENDFYEKLPKPRSKAFYVKDPFSLDLYSFASFCEGRVQLLCPPVLFQDVGSLEDFNITNQMDRCS